ncbi:NADH-quinone oxidoreductase subunit J [Priestia taiwanensis]|uniref:NADH-quinone oxidoreductase subunit J n=1 Tax=Priestia taiwanensis TaxID=1347902 RepID=A0A917AXS7_9BACI|nr:NADH-quinone oxidoreductase subunit J [Priestia taiwanensis]MBM7364340.1 NADH-quinone oxidoreductase subunit J [Priestia taiwanensis]GGE85258.1 NADH:ubiquinone oxidoreductase subunit J [Priestia taiwanensis]
MSGEMIAFSVLAFVAILGGIIMLNVKKVMHMMVALVFTFLSIAGIYVLLHAEFVAVVQVLIYSGAVTILMIFGIMLTKHNDEHENRGSTLKRMGLLTSVIAFGVVMYLLVRDFPVFEQATTLQEKNTEQIGVLIYSHYVIPFELTSILLLVALVGAIILTKKDDEEDNRDE